MLCVNPQKLNFSIVAVMIALFILLIHVWRPREYVLMLYRICPRKFYPVRDFPEMARLSDYFHEIRRECVAVMDAPTHNIPRAQSVWAHGDVKQTLKYVEDTKDLFGWQPAWTPGVTTVNYKWVNMPFIVNPDQTQPIFYKKNLASCPCLAKLLIERSHFIQVAGFSRLLPQMRIAQHTDATGLKFNSAAYHMGLIVPDPSLCSMTVSGTKIYQREGQTFIFESTLPHHASNWSDGDRVILYIDFKINV
jgi:beta-hydroxylase